MTGGFDPGAEAAGCRRSAAVCRGAALFFTGTALVSAAAAVTSLWLLVAAGLQGGCVVAFRKYRRDLLDIARTWDRIGRYSR